MKKLILIISCILGVWGSVFGQADLHIITGTSSVTPNNQVHIGTNIDVQFSVENIGNAFAGQTFTKIYISPNANGSDARLLGRISLESLSAGATSMNIHFQHAVPYNTWSGQNYIFITLNEDVLISESSLGNNNASIGININSIPWAEQYLPYPIILAHGYNSKSETWNFLLDSLANLYGWGFGGRMDFCLNGDNNLTTSNQNFDFIDFTLVPNYTTSLKKCDFFAINFDIDPNGTNLFQNTVNSNQSGAVKQGLAIKGAIKHVLDSTNKNKVVLLGHSMGGLASREYLQNSNLFQINGSKSVAKLATLGTPHGGSNSTVLFSNSTSGDIYSEAIRDLKTSYFPFAKGVYLFGGNENDVVGPVLPYYNNDINCNGFSNDLIIGLNNKYLPNDISYSCAIGTSNTFGGDGIVSKSSAYLDLQLANSSINSDSFIIKQPFLNQNLTWHTALPEQVKDIIKLIDEPNNLNFAFEIELNKLYNGTISEQSGKWINRDFDGFKFNIPQSGIINFELFNLPTSQFLLRVYNSNQSNIYTFYSNGKSYLNLTKQLIAGNYYIGLEADATPNSWLTPYAFKITNTPVPASFCNGTTTLIPPTGSFSDGSNTANYLDNGDCKWQIQPSGASSITLNFTAINIHSSDTVIVYDGNSTNSSILLKATGATLPASVSSTGNAMLVRFKTDGSNVANGWDANYTTTLVPVYCNGLTTLTANSGALSDGSSNTDYGNYSNCSWLISPANAFAITLSFQNFNTEAGNDIVNVYDGIDNTGTLLGSYSGNAVPTNITSTGGSMYVEFITNGTVTSTGWDAIYTAYIPSTYTGITAYEYWFDENYANKTNIQTNPTNVLIINTDIQTTGVSNGLHILHIRFMDYLNVWSSIYSSSFLKSDPSYYGQKLITDYEYWIDTNYNNAVSLAIPPTTNFNIDTALSLINIPIGLHTINIRYKDNTNTWSSVYSALFLKNNNFIGTQKMITQYEYWIDSNYANVVNNSITPTVNFNLDTFITTLNVPLGLHALNIRYKDNADVWSSVYSSLFLKNTTNTASMNSIIGYRYWFDSAYSNITNITLPIPVATLSILDSIATGSLTQGFHLVHCQFLDTLQSWSSVLTDTFYNATKPKPSFTYANNSPCANGKIVFTNTSIEANKYKWYFGNGDSSSIKSPIYQYATSGNYIVTLKATDSISGRDSSISISINVSNNLPDAVITNVGTNTICTGDTATLSSSLGSGFIYSWLKNNVIVAGVNISALKVFTAGTYKSIIANGSCIDTSASKVISQINKPNVVLTTTDSVLCFGDNTNLVVSGASTYLWANTNQTISTINVSPMVTTIYTVTGTGTNGCTKSTQKNITVHQLPNIQIATLDSILCFGDTTILNASGGNSYLWINNSSTINTISIYPNSSTNYILKGTDNFTCINFDTLQIIVNPLPLVSITSSKDTICTNDTIVLSTNIANTYLWNVGGITTQSIMQNPIVNTNFNVQITDTNSCKNTGYKNIIVNALPIITIVANQDSICIGDTVSLTASGANTYLWQPTNQSSANIIAFPIINTSYLVSGTNSNNCVNSKLKNIVVNALPIISIVANQDSICSGDTVSLTASGATTYLWQSTNQSSANIIAFPIINTSYLVSGTDSNSCVNSATKNIIVNPLPIPQITSVTDSLCIGDTLLLSAFGGNTYLWLPSNSTANFIAINPAINTTYSLVATDVNNCKNTAQKSITVLSLPTISISNDTSICIGDTINLTASGGNNFIWTPNTSIINQNQAIANVFPISNIQYFVKVTDINNCNNSDSVSVSVNPIPVINLGFDTIVCVGTSYTIHAGAGLKNYKWNNGSTDSILAISTSGKYWVEAENNATCTTSDTINVEFKICTNVQINPIISGFINLYPNPTTGTVTIDFETKAKRNVVVLNNVGQKVYQITLSERSNSIILPSNITSGIYIFDIQEGKRKYVFKVTKL
jgi:pimeloyl-ACP methyl ester carboxylesterase